MGFMIQDSINIAKTVGRGLTYSVMDVPGLSTSLEKFANHITKVYQIKCNFFFNGSLQNLSNRAPLQLYRIAQEAVNNAINHGKANIVNINLTGLGNKVVLSVDDNGVGIANLKKNSGDDESDYYKGMGLRIMNQRAILIGAKLDVINNPRQGVDVICVVQLTPESDPDPLPVREL